VTIDAERQGVIVAALENGASFDEAADLAGVARKALREALLDGVRDGESGHETEASRAGAAATSMPPSKSVRPGATSGKDLTDEPNRALLFPTGDF
jgi:hypothetical protein